jgi:hypothetical protein
MDRRRSSDPSPGKSARAGPAEEFGTYPQRRAWIPSSAEQAPQEAAVRHQDREFDPEYLEWREEQLRRFDEDYRNWREERYRKFSEEFDAWRRSRPSAQQAGASSAQSIDSGQGGASVVGTGTIGGGKAPDAVAGGDSSDAGAPTDVGLSKST